jgi:hypothetical protein
MSIGKRPLYVNEILGVVPMSVDYCEWCLLQTEALAQNIAAVINFSDVKTYQQA